MTASEPLVNLNITKEEFLSQTLSLTLLKPIYMIYQAQ